MFPFFVFCGGLCPFRVAYLEKSQIVQTCQNSSLLLLLLFLPEATSDIRLEHQRDMETDKGKQKFGRLYISVLFFPSILNAKTFSLCKVLSSCQTVSIQSGEDRPWQHCTTRKIIKSHSITQIPGEYFLPFIPISLVYLIFSNSLLLSLVLLSIVLFGWRCSLPVPCVLSTHFIVSLQVTSDFL